MRQCICQICVCGRHRCEHTCKRRVPFAKEDGVDAPTTEHKERYRPFPFQPRQQPVKPKTGAQWKGSEPSVKFSTTKKDFVAFPIKKRSLMRPKVFKEPRSNMANVNTTYQHDFVPKRGIPSSRVKVPDPCNDGSMPGTLPGKIECSTTYKRCYTPKPLQPTEKASKKECTLTEFNQPFAGETETGLSYRRPPYQKREKIIPVRGTLKAGGDFFDSTTHRTDFPPKYVVPERPVQKVTKWRPGDGKFQSDTTHRHDYKHPYGTDKAVSCAPKADMQKFEGPFDGQSHYKHDFQAYELPERELPRWHPSSIPFKASKLPFEGETTYRTDYEAPPDDLPRYEPSRPLKSNLTLPKGPMERLTTSMRDYRGATTPVVTRSFRPDGSYKRPSEKFAGRTITSTDYTPKKSDKIKTSKLTDNLKPGKGLMDDMSMTMKDFQWLAIECPATYIKLFGKDALPNYEFEKTEGGHDFFRKLKNTRRSKITSLQQDKCKKMQTIKLK